MRVWNRGISLRQFLKEAQNYFCHKSLSQSKVKFVFESQLVDNRIVRATYQLIGPSVRTTLILQAKGVGPLFAPSLER